MIPKLNIYKWHDFKIDYNAQSGALVYKFDGRVSQQTILDFDKLNMETAEDESLLFWGVTAATGKRATSHAVVFTELPNLGSVEYNQDVKRQDDDQSVNQSTDSVQSGDKLYYEYDLAYDSGNSATKKLSLKASLNPLISLPKKLEETLEVTYEKSNGEIIKGTDFKAAIVDNHLTIDDLPKLGPEQSEETFYTGIKVKLPFVIDDSFSLKEAKTVTDNVFVVQEATKKAQKSVYTKSVEYVVNPVQAVINPKKATDLSRELKENETAMIPGKSGITKSLDGQIENKSNLDLTGYKIKVTGNGLVDGNGEKIDLEGLVDDKNNFSIPLGKSGELIASKKINYHLIDQTGKVLARTDQIVIDNTPPEASMKSPLYVIKGSLENEDIDASFFLEKCEDSNPNNQGFKVKMDHETWLETLVVSEVDKETGEYKPKKASVLVSDDVGNTVDLNENALIVVPEALWIQGENVTLTSQELIKNTTSEPTLIEKRERIEDTLLIQKMKEKGLKAFYVDSETNDVVDISNELQFSDVDQVDYHPQSPGYPIKAHITKDGTKVEKNILVKVIDGSLKLSVADDFAFTAPISAVFNQEYQMKESVDLNISDSRFAVDGWTLNVLADDFKKQDKTVDSEKLQLVGQINGGEEVSLQNEAGLQLTNTTEKSLLNNDLKVNSSILTIRLKAPQSTMWATKTAEYTADINWNLTPSNADELSMVSLGKPNQKEGIR